MRKSPNFATGQKTMEHPETLYISCREAWRKWLEAHFEIRREVWLVYPKKSSGKPRILYNDAVEEALCFGWIDSTVRSLDEAHSIQRFTPRKPKSSYSQPNKERLKWLAKENRIHPSVVARVTHVINEKFVFPEDILNAIRKDPAAWENYRKLSESYKRIRIAYIDVARDRPDEFRKRQLHFIAKTKENKLIKGFGGIEKYY
ncbi:MAG: YdeI/OmpD-associated family protein [Sinomicrobium sp.]|nr:YdeI/OmpD-associated family protein [Sinomicrobium sp.]